MNDDGISFGLEIAIERVGVSDLERNATQEIEKRSVVEWLTHRRDLWLVEALVGGSLGVDRVVPISAIVSFPDMLHEAEGGQSRGIEPAHRAVVHSEEERDALNRKNGAPGGAATYCVAPREQHCPMSYMQVSEAHIV